MFDKDLTVIVDRLFKDKDEVIAYLTHLSNPYVIDATDYQKDIIERENVISTCIGFGFAIPHAKSNSVKSPFVIYAKLKDGISWDESEGTVNQVFMLGVPKAASGQDESSRLHLKILSELSKNLMRTSFREALTQAKNNEDVYKLLKTVEEGMSL